MTENPKFPSFNKKMDTKTPKTFRSKKQININEFPIITRMDIETVAFSKLRSLKEQVILNLGSIEANINYYKHKSFRTKTEVQVRLVKLKDDKNYYERILNDINKRLKRGW